MRLLPLLFLALSATASYVSTSPPAGGAGSIDVQSAGTACPVITPATLCNSKDQRFTLPEQCASANIKPVPDSPCCRLQAEVPLPCTNETEPLDGIKCRSVTVETPACPSTNPDFCNIKKMTLTMSLTFQTLNNTCCNQCTCYGDPHCISFNGSADTWVICDARVIKPGTNNQVCPEQKSMCLKQVDNLGNPCVWTPLPPGAKKWNIGLQGSQCIYSDLNEPPNMIMYRADNFVLNLIMGERSIIQSLVIQDTGSGAGYFLSAENCQNDAGTGVNPWRDSATATSPPTDPDWLPNTSGWGEFTLDGGDQIWFIENLPSKIELSIRCTRTLEVTNGVVLYGAPRLSIEQLVEPLNYETQRTNVGGFCATGYIAKEGSTANTNMIMALGACQIASTNLVIAKILCSPATTQDGVAGCELDWCASVRTDVAQCVSDINTVGWAKTYCASKTVPNKEVAGCTGGNCERCMQDIDDFGWAAAVNTWNQIVAQGGNCVTRPTLSPTLSTCQDGVTLQYYAGGTWIDYLAVPSFQSLCEGQVVFTSTTDPLLFQYPIRVIQCSLGIQCLANMCTPQSGFTASFTFTATPNVQSQCYDLLQLGELVCNPKKYTNATACLSEPVPPLCAC